MEDIPDPERFRDLVYAGIHSPWLELTGKALLLLALLFASSFLSAIEAAFSSFYGNKKEPAKAVNRVSDNIASIKSSIPIVQFLLKVVAGITIADILRQLLNIGNPHIFYALVLLFVFTSVLYGQGFAFLAPKNKDYHENQLLINGLFFIAAILSPLSNTLAAIKKYSQATLKKKGYIQKEPKTDGKIKSTTNLAKAAAEFNVTTVKQVMRSRLDITAFNMELGFHELLENLNKFGFSRVPVYRDTIDKIEGILYIKDLLPYIGRSDNFPWQNLLRPAYFIPENKKIEELLREFQEKHAHMALVVDGYGGISGLITLEDILEEIVGEINDELDEVDLNYIKLDDYSYIFEGKTSLNDFSRILGIDSNFFEEVKGESESLGGVLLQLNSNLPKKGDKIFYKNFVFRIDSANNKRIKKVKVEVLQENEVNQDAEN